MIKNHQCFFSEEIKKEYFKTIDKPRFKNHKENMSKTIQSFSKIANLVKSISPLPSSFHLPDPDDEIYLATALSIQADIIVTGNKKDFPLFEYGEVKILSPREFLDQYTDLDI